MKHGICNLPLIPLRSEPSERSEMVSQVLFGELFELLESRESWSRIRLLSDQYTGWCSSKMIQLLPDSIFRTLAQSTPNRTVSVFSKCTGSAGTCFLPAGSLLYDFDARLGTFSVYQVHKADEAEPRLSVWSMDAVDCALPTADPVAYALLFLNAPYLWGGKSILGIDCSGLVQVVFSLLGLFLPRDASQQAQKGRLVSNLDSAQVGDLAFFANTEGRIVHVGLLLDPTRIIHASGSVHIDSIDQTGIFSEVLGCYTHLLHSIRRMG